MHIDRLRKLCLSFPGASEQIQWEDQLLFKVGGRMFAITSLEPSPVWLCFKTAPEMFVDLTERPGIIPAPYLAKAKWVGLESRDALGSAELEQLLRDSYEIIRGKLPRKIQERLAGTKTVPTAPKRSLRLKKTRHPRPLTSRKRKR